MTSSTYVLLNARTHQHLRLATDPVFSHAATTQLAAVVFSELLAVASCMPVVIISDKNAPPALTAVLGLTTNENLFIADQWQGHVVPLSLQASPFNYAIEDNRLLTLIDEASALWQADGTKLFASDLSATPFLKQRQAVLGELARGERLNQEFITCLEQHGLLKPLTVKINTSDGQGSELAGMLTIDESSLARLPGETIYALHTTGMLAAIHAMMLSLRQFNRLVQLARMRGQSVQTVQLL